MPSQVRPANPFADVNEPTLQKALVHVDQAANLDWRLRRELKSAIASAALWLHRTPSEIPANHVFLRQAFARLHPAALQVSKGRFQNVRSLLKRVLAEMGIATSGRNYLAPMSPAWQALYDHIPDPYAKESLARFLRYASRQRIEPEQVDDTVLKAYEQALNEEDLTAKPYIAAQSAARLWNRMVETIPVWPQRRLSPLRRRERHTLEWHQLPQRFLADVERYLTLQSGADPTDPLAPPRPLKPLSLRTRRYQILQLVSALHHEGVDVGAFVGLVDLCKPDHARLALQHMITRYRARKGETADPATSMIGGLAHALKAIAKHYVQAPPDTLTEIGRLSRRLSRRCNGMTEKNRQRLAQVDDPTRRHQLLRFAREEMARLAQKAQPTRRDGVRYSVLLGIEILILAPMRIDNLARLDLDRHILLPSGSKQGAIGLTLPRENVKNEQPLDYRIPAEEARGFYTYLERFRPLLLSRPSRSLFPSYKDGPKRSDTLSKQISKLLKNELGLEWNPHLFRHLAIRLELECMPGNYEGARRLLGHRSAETTFKTYEGGEMRAAVEHYDRLIEDIRGPAPHFPARRRRSPSAGRGL